MKKLMLTLAVVGSLGILGGCVAVPVHDVGVGVSVHGSAGSDGRGHSHGRRDRDRDGVPNRDDRRPDNPRRY